MEIPGRGCQKQKNRFEADAEPDTTMGIQTLGENRDFKSWHDNPG
jgi:hypothetical protein